jgi:transketolase
MGSLLNGIALEGHTRPYGGTFLVFSDYMRPAVRLAALMELPVTYVWTHDSIGLGEDGPTHQPIEHLMALRLIPNLTVLRPADANETVAAWRVAMRHRNGPVALSLTRQKVPVLAGTAEHATQGVARGAYVITEAGDGRPPRLVLIGTGSEVQVAVAAREQLEADGVPTRVVSMPSWELFAAQDRVYRDAVLPPHVTARVSVEAGRTLGWREWVGSQGRSVGLDHFGASADYHTLYEEFGITAAHVVAAAHESLAAAGGQA